MKRLRVVMAVVLNALLLSAPASIAQQDIPQPEALTNTVFIAGEVFNPGAFQVKASDSVFELIARAGGATPAAALAKVFIKRGTTSVTLDVVAALRQGGAKPDFILRDGDFVVVPRKVNRVLVIGEVKSPGSYAIPENGTLSVAEALALAGGIRLDNEIKNIIVLRQKVDGTTERHVFSVNAAGPKLKQPLQSNDVVYVERAIRSAPWQAPFDDYIWFF